jgi:hypothetical protein
MLNIVVKCNFPPIFVKKFELQKNISQINHQPAEKLFLKRLKCQLSAPHRKITDLAAKG